MEDTAESNAGTEPSLRVWNTKKKKKKTKCQLSNASINGRKAKLPA
jgi:hypothetical protein